mgnify:CR=1 FL=1
MRRTAAILRHLSAIPARVLVVGLCIAPAAAQNPPAGRHLPTVCSAGTCTGGVSQWAAGGPGAPALNVNGKTMTIRQARQRELFNWSTFDVAKGHTVNFDQAFGEAALALNRVLGTTNPQSFINGTIKAPGDVLVINQNGILFGANARVNTRSLTASSLNLWDIDEFLASDLTAAIRKVDGSGNAAPAAAFDHTGAAGPVEVAAGAHIKSADGGRVMLVAPSVRNAGTIESPGGQTVLAASHDKVYIAASNDPNLRGLVVEVDTGGRAENVGELIAERGNVSMVGLAVNQDGLARATTAVNFNGSVRLSARHKAGPGTIVNNSGNVSINTGVLATLPAPGDPLQEFGVTLGAGSRTEVLPDSSDPTATIDATPQRRSQVAVTGKTVRMESGARITAPGGEVSLRGVRGSTPGEVSIGAGAVIDVAGTDDTVLPMSANLGEIELRGNELADFPAQRDGVLRGARVQFDLRGLRFEENDPVSADDDQYFLPIGNVTAAVTSTRRGINERLAAGGEVTLEGDVVNLAPGSLIDFSGGAITYEPGFLQTSWLVSEGRVFHINSADPFLVYDAVLPYIDVSYDRWGVTDRFNVFGQGYGRGQFEAGYTVGYDAGALRILGADISLDGELRGRVTRGRLQRDPPGARIAGRLRFPNEVPLGGLLELGQVVLQTGLADGPAGIRLGSPMADETDIALSIPAQLIDEAGIDRVRVVSSGVVRIGDLRLAPGGSLAATASGDSTIDGTVVVPAGTVDVSTQQLPALRPALTVTGTIDVSGQWVNDTPLLNPEGPDAPLFVDGGSVSLRAEGDLVLAPGSVIAVDGGAHVHEDGSVTGGAAGAITIASIPNAAEQTGTRLTLDGSLHGYSLAGGGSLALAANRFWIGGERTGDTGIDLDPAFFTQGGFTHYALDALGEFDSIDTALVEFAADRRVSVRAENYTLGDGYADALTGTPLAAIADVELLPEALRPATFLTVTTNRRLFSGRDARPSLTIGAGASIATEAGGGMELSARDRIVVDGMLAAPAGHIGLGVTDAGGDVGFRNEGIWLLDQALLDVRGVDLTFVGPDGLRTGDVRAGGTIELLADRGSVVIAPGAQLDVSGTVGMVDVLGADGLVPRIDSLRIPSAAGVIELRASETLLPYGEFRGFAGGPGAAAGTLRAALDLSNRTGNVTFSGSVGDVFPEDARVLSLGQRPAWRDAWTAFDSDEFITALRTPAFAADGTIDSASGGVHGAGLIDPASITGGGFEALALRVQQSNAQRADGLTQFLALPAEVRLSGDVDITLGRRFAVDAPVLSSDGGHARIVAPSVMLGSTNTSYRVGEVARRNLFDATSGSGSLAVEAGLIDLVGFMSLKGFGRAAGANADTIPLRLSATGDLRLHGLPVAPLNSNTLSALPEIQGAFETAADLELTAAQIYPTTLSEFTVSVRGENGTLSVKRTGAVPQIPLSAGGNVTLAARNIDQGGVVRAPLGRLQLLAGASDATAIARAEAAASTNNPYNGATVIQAIAGSDNGGRAGVRGTVVSTAALDPSDYRLDYLGSDRYTLTRLRDGAVTNIDTGGAATFTTATIDGFRLTLTNGALSAHGDTYFVRHGDDPLLGAIEFGPGSVTGVAGADLAVPFGELLLEDNWILPVNGVTRTLDEPRLFESSPSAAALAQRPFNPPDRPWTKRLEVRGADVSLAAGAVLDLSGGGDLIAAEFRPGPGGSRDILNANEGGVAFALVPELVAAASPLDPFLRFDDVLASSFAAELPAVPLEELQLSVDVNTGSALPVGRYRLLPRGYAILPGAYLVSPDAALIDFPTYRGVNGNDGVPVVAARFGLATGDVLQQRPIGLRVESHEQLRSRAEYAVATANEFFDARAVARDQLAPQLPRDGGRLVLNTTDTLRLAGGLTPNRGDGRSSQVDIVAERIAVVSRATGAPDRVEILAGDLNTLGAESLFLGGTRTFSETALQVDLQALEVTLDEDVVIRAPELLLGALESVTIDGQIRASGSVRGVAELNFAGAARSRAFVRVSADEQVSLSGDAVPGGVVRIGDGAVLSAPGSITIDGSSDVFIDGLLAAGGGSVSLNTSLISVGAVPVGTGGLVIGDLGAFDAQELELASASTIDFYGSLASATRFDRLVFDSDGLRGFDGAGTVAIDAAVLTLRNSGTYTLPGAGNGTGTLRLSADTLELGAGDFNLLGFEHSALRADRIVAIGESVLGASGSLALATDVLGSAESGNLTIEAENNLTLSRLGTADMRYRAGANGLVKSSRDANGSLGGRITLSGDAITLGSTIDLPSGQFTANAKSGDLTLQTGAVIDVAGVFERFATRLVGTAGGSVSLSSASGDTRLAAGSTIDLGGVDLGGGQGTPAGTLALVAPAGTLAIAGAELFGGAWAERGADLVRVPLGHNDVVRGGAVSLDVANAPAIAAYTQLAAGGFARDLSVRVRGTGDLVIPAALDLRAGHLAFTVDRGALDIAGRLDASGVDGGTISLAAGGDIDVSGSLLAAATGPSGDGGRVALETRDGRINLAAGALVDVAGRTAAAARADTGSIRLVAPRGTDNASVAVDPLAANLRGAAAVEVVANRVYDGIERIEALETGAATQIGLDTLRADNDGFAAAADALETLLDPGALLGARLQVMPGIEIRSAPGSTLELATAWSLLDWRAGDAAGLLTLRAAGDLQLNGSLTDGIGQRDNLQALVGFSLDPLDFGKVATLLDGASWRYRLVAGADLESGTSGAAAVASADPLAVRGDGTGDVVLGNGRKVRTGTGDIALAAAGDLNYLDNTAAIYTVGRDAGYGNIAFDQDELDALGDFLRDWFDLQLAFGFDYGTAMQTRDDLDLAPFFYDAYVPGAGYGRDGGDISIAVGGDIAAKASTQQLTDWQVVFGGETGDIRITRGGGTLPTMWMIRPDRFAQNLGTLGGGDVHIAAGGDVSNLSVVLPTSGRPDGDGFGYGPFSGQFTTAGTNAITEFGGGDLSLAVAGNLSSARLLVARGDASVRVGGDVGAAAGSEVDAIFALGNGSIDLVAGGGITVEAMYNYSVQRRPLVNAPGGGALDPDTRTYFFTYGSGSALALSSLGGDVVLENRTRSTEPLFASILGNAGVTSGDEAVLRVYPGTLRARALSGDIVIARGFTLYPDPVGTLDLLADGDIADLGFEGNRQPVTVVQSDADTALLPSILRPVTSNTALVTTFAPGKQRPVTDDQRSWHALTPVHLGDAEPSVLAARSGTIGRARQESRGIRLFLAEPGRIEAGRDILNLDFEIQHPTDATSVVTAGRDFRFTPNRDVTGNLAQSPEDRFQGALFTGPGRGVVLAGRDIDLGTSDGIVSAGNLRNFALPDGGADLQVFAGAGAGPALDEFFTTYVRDLPEDAANGAVYLRELVGASLAETEITAMYAELDAWREALAASGIDLTVPGVQNDPGTPLAAAVFERFFDELERAGVHATTTGSDDYSRGFAAADTLFPDPGASGALSLLLSRIHTEDGGDIDLFVPGGSANTGAAATAAVTKAENELGVVVQSTGNVHGFVRDDFLVNASRVFALQGGNILLWASEGDIDAGRGAKTALAAPPPQVVFDPAVGQFVTVFPPEVAGSGIRNFAPPGVIPGDVFLFAPQGVISAGDAGIASAGNITIGAREVIGADNIDVGGTAVGVPSADIGVAAGLTGVSNVANAASRDAQNSTGADAAQAAAADVFDQASLSIISVEVIGFGG